MRYKRDISVRSSCTLEFVSLNSPDGMDTMELGPRLIFTDDSQWTRWIFGSFGSNINNLLRG